MIIKNKNCLTEHYSKVINCTRIPIKWVIFIHFMYTEHFILIIINNPFHAFILIYLYKLL